LIDTSIGDPAIQSLAGNLTTIRHNSGSTVASVGFFACMTSTPHLKIAIRLLDFEIGWGILNPRE
jgi:hypothetical protein